MSEIYKQPKHVTQIYVFHEFDIDGADAKGKWLSRAANRNLNLELVRTLATTKEAIRRGKKTIECLKTGRAFDAA